MDSSTDWLWAAPMFSGGLCLSAATWLFGRKRGPDAWVLMALLLLLAWWGVANGAMMLAGDNGVKYLFYNSEGLPVLAVPLLALYKAVTLTRPGFKANRWLLWGVGGLVLGFFAYSFSDHFFHLFYAQVPAPGGFLLAHIVPRPPFWAVFVGLPLAVSALAMALLLHGLPGMGPEARREAVSYLVAMAILGAAASSYYYLGLSPAPGLDPTPTMVGVGGMLVLQARLRKDSESPFSLGGDVDDLKVKLFTFQTSTILGIPCGLIYFAYWLSQGDWVNAGAIAVVFLIMPLGMFLIQRFPDDASRRIIFAGALGAGAATLGLLIVLTVGWQGDLNKIPWAFLFPVLVIHGLGVGIGLAAVGAFVLALVATSQAAGLLGATLLSPLGARFFASFCVLTLVLSFMEHGRRRYLGLLLASQDQIKGRSERLEDLIGQRTQQLSETVELLQLEIDNRRATEADLLEAKEAAEKANQAKSEFLANISHELRTPLTHIMGFSDLLREGYVGSLNPEQTEYVNYVVTSSKHLHSLINDLLDMARTETGGLALAPEPAYLETLVQDVVGGQRAKAQAAGVALEAEIRPLGGMIDLDPARMTQVLHSLVANAIKFSPGGAVRVQAWGDALGMTGGNGGRERPHAEIVVSDNGIGLAPHDLERIFKPFEQVDASTTRRFDGSGLGLALAKRLVEMHGGRIWAESRGLGQGSQFHVVLPWGGGEGL